MKNNFQQYFVKFSSQVDFKRLTHEDHGVLVIMYYATSTGPIYLVLTLPTSNLDWNL